MSAVTTAPADAIRGRLTALAADQPALAGAAGLYRAILPLLSAAVPPAARPTVTPAGAAEAAAILAAGRPLLPALFANGGEEAPAFDLAAAENLAARLAAALAEQGAAGATELAAMLRRGGQEAGVMLAALLAGETSASPWERRRPRRPVGSPDATSPGLKPLAERAKVFDLTVTGRIHPAIGFGSWKRRHAGRAGHGAAWKAALPGAAGLRRLVADLALRPQWQAWRREWELHLAGAIAAWGRGECYLCGAAPSLAELRGHEGARYLRCGRCGAAWPYPRLACAGCGSQDPADLGVLIPESDPDRLRIDTCDRCHTYLKAIATFEPLAAEMIAIEDLATLYLDEVAGKEGYRRPERADRTETLA